MNMNQPLQAAIVFLLVGGCAVYAAWRLMPAALRRATARGLLRLPLPARWRNALGAVAAAGASGCGCSGCDRAVPAAKTQPLVFHRRTGAPRSRP